MKLIGYIVWQALLVIPLWRICVRAGFPGPLALLAAVPCLGMLAIGILLSYADWPRKTPASITGA